MLGYDVARGSVELGFTAKPEFLNLGGVVQGGFVCAMLDDGLGFSVIVKTEGKYRAPSIDLHTHFLRPLRLGPVRVEARVTKIGKRLAYTEASLFDQDNILCARATSSGMLTPMPETLIN